MSESQVDGEERGFVLASFLAYNYFGEHHEAWFHAAAWPNVAVIPIGAAITFAWSRTRWWPLRPIKHALTTLHSKLDAHHRQLHARLDMQQEHNEWVADHLAAIHRNAGLGEPGPHPHFDLPAGEPIRVATELPVEEGKDATT